MFSEQYLRLRYIYVLSVVNCVLMIYIFKVDVSFDTYTYIEAWSSLSDGHIDKWRTPVYPLFLGLMNTMCGEKYLYYVVIVQHLAFLFSIRYLYYLLRYSIQDKKIPFFLTLLYALYPCVATYNCCIMTETFAVTGSVFLLYSILQLYKTRKYLFGLYAFFWLLFLVFLRPAVVYLLPITIVGWCIVAIKEKSFFNTSVLCGMAGSVLVSISLIVYMVMFKSSYGVFTPSGIGLINQYTIAKAANVIDLNTTGEELGFYQEAEKYINLMGMDEFSDSLNQSINRNKVRYVSRILLNVRKAAEDNFFEPSWPIGIIGFVSNIMGIKLKILYFVFLIYAIILLRWMNRLKEVAFFSCLLFMIGVSNFILIIMGSPGEYGRLSLPAIPAYLIMIGQLLDVIRFDYICNHKFL